MTGNETLIVKGSKAVYGKVRHDGFDFLDWIKEVGAEKIVEMELDDVWKTYYAWRSKGYKPSDFGYEIESKYQKTGFHFDIPRGMVNHQMIEEHAEDLLRTEEETNQKVDPDYDEGFTCGYGDHGFYINLDLKTITHQGEIIYKNDPFLENGMAKLQPKTDLVKQVAKEQGLPVTDIKEKKMPDFRIFEVKLHLPGMDEQTLYIGAHNGHEMEKWAKDKEVTNDCIITETDYTEETLEAEGKKMVEKAFTDKPKVERPGLVKELLAHGWRKVSVISWHDGKDLRVSSDDNCWAFAALDANRVSIKTLDAENKKIVGSKSIFSPNIEIIYDASYENEDDEKKDEKKP